ncbi:MAG: hypothetical protein J3K34DRAFT_526184 [Monoraphidium minutum]|nr:MAG: hypothetical protein J3K34DRAFT_526184 [Monoraphidium minutum]
MESLPKLPGYQPCLEKQNLGRKQTLTYLKGYANESEPLISCGEACAAPPARELIASMAFGEPRAASALGESLPKWVENDRKVLRFWGYFQESVTESNIENHRVRRVALYYYLADDSLQVTEPQQDNSGIQQGIFVRRHQVPRDDGSGATLAPGDLAVGATVTVYGRTFFLVDCDAYTRAWYRDTLQLEQADALGYPADQVDAYRTKFALTGAAPTTKSTDLATFVEARLGKPSHLLEGDKLRQFIANSGKVLRFWCEWDDRQGMYGDRRPYALHFYLEDDTVEINEVHERNSGRDPFPVFVRRGPLPREKPRGVSLTGRFPKSLCYRPEDLRIGGVINVHGRAFRLYDCDAATREWYKLHLGYPDEMLEAIDIAEPVPPVPRPAVPPYNGYGSLDDSRQNCVALVPKPPKKDMHKLMNKDKIILRFTARMAPTATHSLSHADAGRCFVLSYFLMDDSLLIFEPPVRNSGIGGGKFLERQRIYKPGSEEIYTYQDLYVGGRLEVFNRAFELSGADEYTLNYMENNKHIFVMADADAILESLRAQVHGREDALRAALVAADADGCGALEGGQMEAAFEAAGLRFTRHQLVSLRRRVGRERGGAVGAEEILALLGL